MNGGMTFFKIVALWYACILNLVCATSPDKQHEESTGQGNAPHRKTDIPTTATCIWHTKRHTQNVSGARGGDKIHSARNAATANAE